MSKERYCELIDQVCKKAGISDSQSMYESCDVSIMGINFTLIHGEPSATNSMFIYVDFGEPPADQKAKILQRLMETNLFLYSENPTTFALNPTSQHVLMITHLRLAEVTFEILNERLNSIAQFAQVWRETFFLLPQEQNWQPAQPTEIQPSSSA